MTNMRILASAVLLSLATIAQAQEGDGGVLHDEREVHLADVQQMTFGGENAEAYWSPDSKELVFQSTRPPLGCDQIFRMPINDPAALTMVSTGKGRTTCAYYSADNERIIYSSTHAGMEECPAPPDRSQGYVWPIYDDYQIYSANLDGTDLKALTDSPAYDAEATVCPVDGSIIFTSTRDGDLDLYRMDADGSNVKRLTETPGYDGGAFFSPDCSKIVWRASRPSGDALADYQRLLQQGLIRPGKLEIFVADSDGSNVQQVTYLDGASFAPYFTPDASRILFSTSHHDPKGREFDIFAVNVDGTNLEQITFRPGFDGFPMFSPDGEWLAFASNRNQAQQGDTDVYIARWVDAVAPATDSAADRFQADVAWLADDAREGRGVGTQGLADAADWLEEQFKAIGLEPAGEDGGYRQRFDAVVDIERGDGTSLSVDDNEVAADDYMVPGFSAQTTISAPVVFAEWGIESEDHDLNDYDGLDVEGKIVLVRRFTPNDGVFEDADLKRRFGAIRYKAFKAREHGAIGLLVADLADGVEEAGLPELNVDTQGNAGIPVSVVTRDIATRLLEGANVSMTVELVETTQPVDNIVGRLSPTQRLAGVVMIGAHYDHLGFGGSGSLTPDSKDAHNGADDNASGTAALLEAARELAARREELGRDIVFAAFTAEERGLLGSSELARKPLPGMAPSGMVAMLNMDMVGRLRNNTLSVLGGESAEEWGEIVSPLCDELRISCSLGGDGYGPSDHTPFYAAGVPVLHFFTGAHEEYHKPSDDTALVNAAGGAQIASLVANVAFELSSVDGLTYKKSEAPTPMGDVRSYGASLGTIPDYTGAPDDKPGMLLAGVREGGPAATAGLERGDRIVELAGREIRDIYDLMYVLRESKPGEEATFTAERGEETVEGTVVFGKSSRGR
jgi:Tol biopolymer transport system component